MLGTSEALTVVVVAAVLGGLVVWAQRVEDRSAVVRLVRAVR